MRLIIVCMLLLVGPLQAQSISLSEKESLEADNFVGVDSYSNTYYIKEMALYKDGPLGNFVFKDFQLGPITKVDIINPLNVLVFYRELNTIVFLDNRLNEIERINFNTLETFVNVGWASNAGNNRIWTFNVDTRQLELYNYRSGVQTVVSQPISGRVIDMSSDFNYCYLLTADQIFSFNVYGSALWNRPFSGIQSLVHRKKNLILRQENQLFWWSEDQQEILEADGPELTIKDLQLTQDFLYIYDGKYLNNFTLNQPKQ